MREDDKEYMHNNNTNQEPGQEDIFEEDDVTIPDSMADDAENAHQSYRHTGQQLNDPVWTSNGNQDDRRRSNGYYAGDTSGSYNDNRAYRQTQQDHGYTSGDRYQRTTDSYQSNNSQTHDYSYMEEDDHNDNNGQNHHFFRKHETTPRQKKSIHTYVKALICAIIIGAVGGGMILGSFAIGKNMGGSSSGTNTTLATTSSNLSSQQAVQTSTSDSTDTYTVSQIADQCESSVVAITNKGVSEVQTMFGVYEQESEGSGSGVIIGKNDTELLIATNNHVVEGSESLTVCFNDDQDAIFEAQIKGTDSDNDLAVVAIQLSDIPEDVLSSVTVATIGDSDSVSVGDEVVAIGNALGLGQSVTSGVVSATSREVTIDDYTATLMQTDAAINPGNSGGALFNMSGQLIGINSAKYASSSVEGMGFAIPISQAMPIIQDLMNMETKTKLTENYGFLNITGGDVSSEVSEMYGIPSGVYVASTTDGGAAANAGIQEGDIITKLGDVSVSCMEDLQDALKYYAAGETVTVTLQRNDGNGYAETTVDVKLDNASEQNTSSQSTDQSGQNSQNGMNGGSSNGQSGSSDSDDIMQYFFGNGSGSSDSQSSGSNYYMN